MRTMTWRDDAACHGRDDLDWLGSHVTVSMARLCWDCPVRPECLFEALQREDKCDPGIWGGTNEYERRAIRKNRNVLRQVWNELKEAAA